MTKVIGRKFSVGLGKETTRGTAVAAAYWIPKMDFSLDDKINYAVDDSSIGVIEDSISQDITGKYSEGSIGGRVYDKSFGLILLGVFGVETSSTQVGGETLVYDHLFNVLESASHQSLTISAADPNGGSGLKYSLAMFDTFELSYEVGKYLTYKTSFRANTNASSSVTASFTAENGFRPQDGIIKVASALAGLDAASAISIKKGTLTIKKNIEDDFIIGSVAAADRLNKAFMVEGTIEALYDSRTFTDTNMLADLAQALRIQFINTSVTLGSASSPQITFDMGKVKFQEVSKKIANNDLIMQTVKFKAFYSMADSMMIKATLRNLQSAVY